MNEEYLIKIRGSMEQDGQAPADPIELMTRGSFVRKGSSYYITYKETEATGYAGCTTTLKIAEDGSGWPCCASAPPPAN